MFSSRYKQYFALMVVVLVMGPCVADAPRLLAGWYSPGSMGDSDIREFEETYEAAVETAQNEGNLRDYNSTSANDAAEAAGKMEADFWWVAAAQVSWGFVTRICVLVLLLSVVIRLYSRTLKKRGDPEASRIPGRLGLTASVAVAGFSYVLLMALATEISGTYYFVFTLFLILTITVPKEPKSYKSLLIATLVGTLFWFFTGTNNYALLGDYVIPADHIYLTNQYSLYDYIVRARITTPVYLFFAFLSESLMILVPLYFLSHFGVEGGFSTITAD